MGKLHQKLAFDLDETFEALAQLPDTLMGRARGWRVQDAVFGIDRRHGLAIEAIHRIGIGLGKAAARPFIFGCIHGPHLLCSLLGWISAYRRVGQECVSTFWFRGSPYQLTTQHS